MKILSAFFGLLLNIVLARKLGADGTGVFYLALSCTTIAIVISQFGLGQSLLRFVSVAFSQEDWIPLRGAEQLTRTLCLITSLGVTLTFWWLSPLVATHLFSNEKLSSLMRWMSLAIIPGSLMVLNGFLLQGSRRIKSSVFVHGVSMPMWGTLFMVCLIPYFDLIGAVWGYILASWFTLLVSAGLWYMKMPEMRGVKGSFSMRQLLQSNVPLFWVSLAQLIMVWSSGIMLGIWATESDVGIFSIANKTAILLTFVLSCVNTVIAPQFAALYQGKNVRELQKVSNQATLLIATIASPILLIFILFPEYIMAIFGSSFIQGRSVFLILVVGQFFYVVTGAVGYLLTMSGHEREMRNIMVCCAVGLVGLNFLLIPVMGALGAAVATSVTLVLQNGLMILTVWRKIGVLPFAFR